jgi:hypothetical protein
MKDRNIELTLAYYLYSKVIIKLLERDIYENWRS